MVLTYNNSIIFRSRLRSSLQLAASSRTPTRRCADFLSQPVFFCFFFYRSTSFLTVHLLGVSRGGGFYCPTSQPAWSAYRDPSFGTATLTFASATSATFKWFRTIDGGAVADSVTYTRLAVAAPPPPPSPPTSGAGVPALLPALLMAMAVAASML